MQLKALEVPSFPAGPLAVRDIAAHHPVLFQERQVYCLRRQPLLRAADVLVSGTLRNGAYELDQRSCHAAGAAAIAPIRPADAVIHSVFNHIAPASLRRLRAFFGTTLAGIQRRKRGHRRRADPLSPVIHVTRASRLVLHSGLSRGDPTSSRWQLCPAIRPGLSDRSVPTVRCTLAH
jgi:hypothetical protein